MKVKNFFMDMAVYMAFMIFSYFNPSTIEWYLKVLLIIIISILSSDYLYNKKKYNRYYKISLNPYFVIVLILCFMSSFYSIDYQKTLDSSLSLFLLTLFAYFVMKVYRKEEIIKLYTLFTIFSIILNVILYLIHSDIFYTIFGDTIGFKGIYGHKNFLAANMIFGLIAIDYFQIIFNKKEKKFILLKLAAIFLIIVSNSTTCTIILIVYILISRIFLGNKKIISIWISNLLVILSLIIFIFNDRIVNSKLNVIFFNLVGKDLGFTGRVTIWSFVIDALKNSPILGFGYDAFWSNSYYYGIWLGQSGIDIQTPGVHQGFFDVLVSLGGIGLVIFLLCLYSTYKKIKFKNDYFDIYFFSIYIMINCFDAHFLVTDIFMVLFLFISSKYNLNE